MPEGSLQERGLDPSPPVSDEVKHTTCYMCACRCGIRVHLRDGELRYIEGNPDHPVNKGVLCGKGSAGIMHQKSPAKLRAPLLRTGPRGSGQFREISWDEAMDLATTWLSNIRNDDPKKLAFFTGRDQSQALTGWWASQFGTPNYAAHGGFCSVNMAAAGLYTVGGSFWEFGEPDWERTRYFLLFGVAEDHDSNPIKLGLGHLKESGAKVVSINPVRTGYSAVADEWIGITPGSDGLFVLAIARELILAGRIDAPFLASFTNAPALVIEAPGTARHGLIARDAEGRQLVWDRDKQAAVAFGSSARLPALQGTFTLPTGETVRPSFALTAERILDGAYAPERVAERCGIAPATIRRIAAEIAEAAFDDSRSIPHAWTDSWGRKHDGFVSRPVAVHAMRGISAHANGFHTCRNLHLLQMLLGAVDRPGSWRYKPPYPRPTPPAIKPAGKTLAAGKPMPGPPLGFPQSPDDLLVDANGKALRIDKAYSWEAPLAAHGMLHMVITDAVNGDPYPIDTLFLFMANMAWNSSMNVDAMREMLTRKRDDGEYAIPRIIYVDAFKSETVDFADLVLPDTTYLERWDCISLLDRPICHADGAGDAIRQPILKPDRDVRPFQDVLLELGWRLGLPALTNEDGSARFPGGYPDYLVHHVRKPGQGSLAGWRGTDGGQQGLGPPNKNQLQRYIENGCFWSTEIPEAARFSRHANPVYLAWAKKMGFVDDENPIVLQFYVEALQRFRLAAEGHGTVQPPDRLRERVRRSMDPLPLWYPPFEDETNDEAAFPLHAITQRPMAMYHSWGSMNAWLRQIHAANRLYVPAELAREHGIADDDWVAVSSRHGRIEAQVRVMQALNGKTVWTWNAIGKKKGAWGLAPNAPEFTKGFLLNHLIDELLPDRGGGYRFANSDPVTGQAAWYDLRVRLEKIERHG